MSFSCLMSPVTQASCCDECAQTLALAADRVVDGRSCYLGNSWFSGDESKDLAIFAREVYNIGSPCPGDKLCLPRSDARGAMRPQCRRCYMQACILLAPQLAHRLLKSAYLRSLGQAPAAPAATSQPQSDPGGATTPAHTTIGPVPLRLPVSPAVQPQVSATGYAPAATPPTPATLAWLHKRPVRSDRKKPRHSADPAAGEYARTQPAAPVYTPHADASSSTQPVSRAAAADSADPADPALVAAARAMQAMQASAGLALAQGLAPWPMLAGQMPGSMFSGFLPQMPSMPPVAPHPLMFGLPSPANANLAFQGLAALFGASIPPFSLPPNLQPR
eukprot:m.85068 g.85068  ORF g.85068 m.85068 type:complete len:333 (+) comp8228_c1_seq5:784-1782(+)